MKCNEIAQHNARIQKSSLLANSNQEQHVDIKTLFYNAAYCVGILTSEALATYSETKVQAYNDLIRVCTVAESMDSVFEVITFPVRSS
jgi:hypothetical protein